MGHWLFICPKLLWVESCANTHSNSHSHPKSFIHSHVKTVGHHRHYHRIAAHRTTLQCIASLHFVLVVYGMEKKLWLITSHWRRCICNTFEPFNVAAPPPPTSTFRFSCVSPTHPLSGLCWRAIECRKIKVDAAAFLPAQFEYMHAMNTLWEKLQSPTTVSFYSVKLMVIYSH